MLKSHISPFELIERPIAPALNTVLYASSLKVLLPDTPVGVLVKSNTVSPEETAAALLSSS